MLTTKQTPPRSAVGASPTKGARANAKPAPPRQKAPSALPRRAHPTPSSAQTTKLNKHPRLRRPSAATCPPSASGLAPPPSRVKAPRVAQPLGQPSPIGLCPRRPSFPGQTKLALAPLVLPIGEPRAPLARPKLIVQAAIDSACETDRRVASAKASAVAAERTKAPARPSLKTGLEPQRDVVTLSTRSSQTRRAKALATAVTPSTAALIPTAPWRSA